MGVIERFTFPKELRLLNKKAYSYVFNKAKRIKVKHITLIYRENDLAHPRLGIMIAKKQVKHAVKRNRIKRLARESFRMHQHEIRGIDIIFLGYKGIELLTNQELREQIDKLWQKLTK